MTAPEQHPVWCAFRFSDPRRCFEQDAHASAQIAINPDGNEMVGVRLHLVQLILNDDGTGPVYAHLIITDDEQERTYPLTIRQLSVLSLQARREVELVNQPRPRNEGPQR